MPVQIHVSGEIFLAKKLSEELSVDITEEKLSSKGFH